MAFLGTPIISFLTGVFATQRLKAGSACHVFFSQMHTEEARVQFAPLTHSLSPLDFESNEIFQPFLTLAIRPASKIRPDSDS